MAAWALALGLFLAELCRRPIERCWGVTIALVLALSFQYSHAKFMGSLKIAWRSVLGQNERIEAWRRQADACFSVSWEDFASLRHWLVENTTPDTRIANLAPFINLASNVNRLPAIPIEGTWLWYHRESEPPVRHALQADRDIVVIWNPATFDAEIGDFPELREVIRTQYTPVAQFGVLEVRQNLSRGREFAPAELDSADR